MLAELKGLCDNLTATQQEDLNSSARALSLSRYLVQTEETLCSVTRGMLYAGSAEMPNNIANICWTTHTADSTLGAISQLGTSDEDTPDGLSDNVEGIHPPLFLWHKTSK